jgi:putative nucleotidyltransferase with HDIG domain
MRIQCSHCQRSYNLPDERLPSGRRLTLHCPACRQTIRVEVPAPSTRGAPPAPPAELSGPGDLKRQLLHEVHALPAMPHVVERARRAVAEEAAGTRQIAAILETEPALTGRVLQLANSAYYGFSGRVATVNQAVLLLGMDTLLAMVLLVSSSQLLGRCLSGYGLASGELWRHSLAVAVAARELAKQVCPSLDEEAFSAGLLHDIGKLVLDTHLARHGAALARMRQTTPGPWWELERAILGLDHAEIAAAICRKWRIPQRQAAAIGAHHRPWAAQGEDRPLSSLLNVADALAAAEGLHSGSPPQAPAPEAVVHLGLKAEQLEAVRALLPETVASIAAPVS